MYPLKIALWSRGNVEGSGQGNRRVEDGADNPVSAKHARECRLLKCARKSSSTERQDAFNKERCLLSGKALGRWARGDV
jgi:hypothetical protein